MISKVKSVQLVIYMNAHYYFCFILSLSIFHICEKTNYMTYSKKRLHFNINIKYDIAQIVI